MIGNLYHFSVTIRLQLEYDRQSFADRYLRQDCPIFTVAPDIGSHRAVLFFLCFAFLLRCSFQSTPLAFEPTLRKTGQMDNLNVKC